MSQWYHQAAAGGDESSRIEASRHSDSLTKPPGSLGRLEALVIDLAGLQSKPLPSIEHIAITIFAADHGVAREGVSAFPQVVTGEMIRNFSSGGAAITVLARQLGASFSVVNVGTVKPMEAMPNVQDRRVAAGTENFTVAPAMTWEQCVQALTVGQEMVAGLGEIDLFIGGEMGIANTCSASAIASALLKQDASLLVGEGTGVNADGLALKLRVIKQALALHGDLDKPLGILQALGGFEIAALTGAYISAAQKSIPVLVDGFICSVAASVAVAINPSIRSWLLFSHQSAEAGHRRVLQALDAQPLLQLDMRLGEGSGAAMAVPLIQMACAMHSEMASFEVAGVSTEECAL
jgi:nicotinate-nucleotide--dimethylbenzimidazole phosphoribosyltransferase